MHEVNYYEDARGRRPVEEFIDGAPAKTRAKVFGRLELLEEHGPALGMPFSRHLDDGIFELRTVQGSDITRAFHFFVAGGEIERAKRMREDRRSRNE